MIARGEFRLSLNDEPITSDNATSGTFSLSVQSDKVGNITDLPSLGIFQVRHAIVCHIIRGTVDCYSQWW